MKNPKKYTQKAEAIQFLPDGSNWRDVCKFMGDENDYPEEGYRTPPEFLYVGYSEIYWSNWLVLSESGNYEIIDNKDFEKIFTEIK